MDHNHDIASDAGRSAVPQGRPGAELPVNPMRDTTDTEPMALSTVERFQIVGRVREAMSCPKCLENGLNDVSLGAFALDGHIKTKHPDLRVTWECNGCSVAWPSVRSWSSHLAKCKGPPPPSIDLQFKCDHCVKSFASKGGLSTHERFAHPNIRNDKRRELAERPKGIGGRRATVWSEEELAEIERREAGLTPTKSVNQALARFFPGKTQKQISDARRRIARRKAAAVEPEAATLDEDEEVVAEEPANPSPQAGRATDPPARAERTTPNRVNPETGPRADPPLAASFEQAEEPWKGTLESAIRLVDGNPRRWSEWIARLKGLVNDGNPTGNDIDGLYDDFLRIVKAGSSTTGEGKALNRQRGHRRTNGRSRHRPANRTTRRAHAFAKCQDLMNNAPKKLADIVMANDLSLLQQRRSPPRALVQDLYESLWGVAGPRVSFIERPGNIVPVENLLRPVTPIEIERRLGRIPSSSATGPDGVARNDLHKPDIHVALAGFLNLLFLTQHYPEAWKANRTTLIPKVGKDCDDVRNWRPITVSSMLSRIFSGLLDQRLRSAIKQSDRQKGFTPENGCYTNVHLLNAALKEAKDSGGVVSVLDVSKAFDTVPHSAIETGLLRKGIPPLVAHYVASMYFGCKTRIRAAEGEVDIELRRGVKQGDPLSPLIFNLTIEPLIDKLQDRTPGIGLGHGDLAVLAFADDLVLLSRSVEGAGQQLGMVHRELQRLGMSLAADKCLCFQYKPAGKTWYLRDPAISVDGVRVPYAEPEAAFKYLGTKVSPWKGLLRDFEIKSFREIIERAKRLPLKPMQKIDLLVKYLFPRFTYGLISSPPPQVTLRNIDILIRTQIRQILHLSASTSSEYLHAPRRVGGLGLPHLSTSVPIAALRNGIKALETSDPLARVVFADPSSNRMREYAKSLALPWPLTRGELDEFKTQTRRRFQEGWAEQVWQGQGARDFAEDPISNSWLVRGDLLSSSRVIDAIKLRTNLIPTRAAMKRFEPDMDDRCRHCRADVENLGHILGRCPRTKAMIIRRHDEIKELLRDRLARSNQVLCEQVVRIGAERLRPDLVIQTPDGTTHVLDVTVRYENKDFLGLARQEKIEKYTRVVTQMANELDGRVGRVLPIVVGSRGAMPSQTIQVLRELNIPKSDWLTISLIALRSSIEMVNSFMDG